MAYRSSILRIRKCQFTSFVPVGEYHVVLDGVRRGPFRTDQDAVIDKLMQGDYRLTGKWTKHLHWDSLVPCQPGSETRINPFDARWRMHRQFLGRAPKNFDIHLEHIVPETVAPAPRKISSQFWAGRTDNPDAFYALFDEGPFWAIEDEEVQDNTPLHPFCALQDEMSMDHDFLEYGHEADPMTGFMKYSWAKFWIDEFRWRATQKGLSDPNCFALVGVNEKSKFPLQIKNGCDFETDGVVMRYLGVITHDDYPV